MSAIQPVLVPSTGTLADLHVTVDPSSADHFQIYWGTALLQVIPRDKTSMLFRISAGLLLNLKFRIGGIAKAFGVSEKPLRIWRDALKNGDLLSLGSDFDRLKTKGKLRADVKRYIRVKYWQACENNGGRRPYGFLKQLCEQVAVIWPDQEVCKETLRQLFCDEDTVANSTNEVTAVDEDQKPMDNAGEAVDLDPNSSQAASITGDMERFSSRRDSDDNCKSSPDFSGGLRSDDGKKRESTCDSYPSVGHEPFSFDAEVKDNRPFMQNDEIGDVDPLNSGKSSFADDDNRKLSPDFSSDLGSGDKEKREFACDSYPSVGHEPYSSDTEVKDNRPLMQNDEIGDVDPLNSGKSSFADDDNRKLSPDFSSDLSSGDKEKREFACDSSEQLTSTHNPLKTGSTLPNDRQAKSPPNRSCFPLLSGEQPGKPFISQHAGILLLAPEFDEAFDHLPAILRQTAAQILIGCVNQEQGKLIDYNGLSRIAGKVIRDLKRQRTLLDLLAEQGVEARVYEGNIRLLKLRSADELILYCDTHHSEYTGCERIVQGWSGLQKKALRGIMMEFFHTAQGQPCMVGHYDNFYDGRQRFFLLRERLVERLLPWSGHFVWVHDRGYWGYDFLRQIVECDDIFIQWEKNYKQDGWDQPYQHDGNFPMTLQGNSSRDQRKQVKVDWREQKWDRFANGRRFIVRVKHASGQNGEVAIVTSHPTMPAEKVIRLMLSRFLQENDFSYLNRHVGINELTARKFDRYQAIAHELKDRDVDSRAYKKAKKQKLALQEKLKQCLFKIDGLSPISFATLKKDRTRLRQQKDRLAEQLSQLAPRTVADNVLARLSRRVHELKEKFHLNSDQRVVAEERRAEETKRHQLHQQIDEVNGQLAQISRTESRLLMFIEEQYMRPNMDRKVLVDAVRITSRNGFCRVLQDFRPYYDNYRDDHVVLRL